jgi:hypothetical protein
MRHLGDFDLSTVVYGKFTTFRPATGASFTLGGTPALQVYKDNNSTQSSAGVTLSTDFNAVTGLNHFAIDTSADAAFYAAGSFFYIVISAGTVDSVNVVGSVVASFTLRKDSSLKPATAGRTLVVDAAGLADANAVKVGPTGAGTAQTARDVGASVLLSPGTGLGQLDITAGVAKASLVQILGTALTETAGQLAGGFKKFFNIGAPNSTMDTLTLVATATSVTNLTNAPTAGDFTGVMKASLNAATPAVTVSDKTGFSLSAAGVQAIWDALTAALVTVGSIGKYIATTLSTYAGGAVASVTGAVGSVSAPVTVGTNNDKTGYALTAAYDPAKTAAQPGNAMALTSGERTTLTGVTWAALTSGLTTPGSIGLLLVTNINAAIGGVAASVWSVGARTLTSFGTLAADTATAVWAATTRTLTSFGFPVALTPAYDAAKTAAQTLDAMTLSGDFTATMKASLNASTPAGVPTAAQNATALLTLDWTGITGEAAFSALNALRGVRNKIVIAAGVITVYAEDGTRVAYTEAAVTDPSAEPIVSVTPS